MSETVAFQFLDPGHLVDGDLELYLVDAYLGDKLKEHVPTYHFEMRRIGDGEKLGTIRLRIGTQEALRLYAGHIGYSVDPRYRGKHYAARSCRLLFPLAKRHGLNPLWITCNPENGASRKTCEAIGAVYVETVAVPETEEMYQRGERQKCRYRIDL